MVTHEAMQGLGGLTFEKAFEVTSSVPMIVAYAIVWFSPILIYIIWGAVTHAKTSDGRKLPSMVIENTNFWIGLLIFGLFQFALFLIVLVFPVWLLPF